MSIRTALTDNGLRIVPFAVLLVIAWLGLTVLNVWNRMDPIAQLGGGYVGHPVVSGVVGLLVLLVVAFLFLSLYGEATESGSGPEEFPPR
ncbi:hypothetical protein ACFQPA_15195 [Halomarina halobia]|uniref:Cox cluster protein n=1 Tax=Halomarina halobia TaxID=3033386 RepID=A0ABD6A7L3_9EURY|nr:hypothetical protein [Halomarina sp. PSR21]